MVPSDGRNEQRAGSGPAAKRSRSAAVHQLGDQIVARAFATDVENAQDVRVIEG
jgi:hypothetical protein